jgi:hypothetical protein
VKDNAFIYSGIRIYRLCMNLLYKGGYKMRFTKITDLFRNEKSVIELCFGDIIIAEHCKKIGIDWQGYDVNPAFIDNAKKQGFNVCLTDLKTARELAKADLCIISGSLYHFHDELEELFRKILHSSPRILISEPVINLSGQKGLIGKLAKGSADVNGRSQEFRYNEKSLIAEMEKLSKKLKFTYCIRNRFSKDLIIEVNR